MIQKEGCKICGSYDFKKVHSIQDHATKIKKKFNIVKCNKCSIVFICPQPGMSELSKHYQNNYYSLEDIKTHESSRSVRLRTFLYDIYFNPSSNNYLAKFVFSPLKIYLRGTVIHKDLKLLDVGSGSGQFLYEMKRLELDVSGIEPGNFNEKSAKENLLRIQRNDLKKSKLKSNEYDLVTMNHVLEHTPDPSGDVGEIYRILKRGGLFIVAVPNYRSLAYKIFGKNWYQLDVPRHLFDFSDEVLEKILKDAGFKIKKRRYNSRPSQFSFSLSRKFGIKFNRLFLLSLNIMFLPLTYMVNLFNYGDSVEFWCIK